MIKNILSRLLDKIFKFNKKIFLLVFWFGVSFLHIGHNIVLWAVCWWENFNQNGVFTHFANLTKRNKKFIATFKQIPKILLSRNNNPCHSWSVQIKHNVSNVTKISPINNVNHFLTPKFKKRCFQINYPFVLFRN